jgi:hypothetical protein
VDTNISEKHAASFFEDFDPEEGSIMFLQNVPSTSILYSVTTQKTTI